MLIENEFGEIGIDGGFLQDAGIEITEMNSGCICCTPVSYTHLDVYKRQVYSTSLYPDSSGGDGQDYEGTDCQRCRF